MFKITIREPMILNTNAKACPQVQKRQISWYVLYQGIICKRRPIEAVDIVLSSWKKTATTKHNALFR